MRTTSLLPAFAFTFVTLVASASSVAAQDTPPAADAATATAIESGGPRLGTLGVLQRAASPSRVMTLPRADEGGFASSGFAQFMSSPAGRVLRVVAGAGMIAGGISADSDLGTGVAIAGAVPLLAGTFDVCVLSPLFGGPFRGRDIRAAKGK